MDVEEIRAKVQSRNDWWHSIDFGHGVVSEGKVTPEYQREVLRRIQLPDRLDGMRVLDIGTHDGFFAFECERRNAAQVVAIDVCPVDCHCFKLAHDLLGSRVEYRHMGVYELDEAKLGGPFDLVLFLGVFYHLRHIFIGLDNIWRILTPTGLMLMETHVCDEHFVLGDGTATTVKEIDRRVVDTPIFRFYRRNDLHPADWSNWFGGNVAAIMDCLGSAGFRAQHLGSWAQRQAAWACRAAFRAEKNPRLPREWEVGSYEGTHFEYREDGSWTLTWHAPAAQKG